MSQERTLQSCRFCKSSRVKYLLRKDDALIFRCLDCGVVFLGNELDEESIKGLYKYYSSTGFSNHLSPITRLHYEKLLDSFEKYRKNNAIIDVGCGAGYFMLSASMKGWQVDGTEISDEAIRLVEEKGQKAFKGDAASLELEKGRYDIVTLLELIEHAADPEGLIRKLSYILRPGGLVYITTPNYNSLTRKLTGKRWGMFSKEHFFYFKPKHLMKLLKKYNFKILNIKTENLSLGGILKIFRKPESLDSSKVYESQEAVRGLVERKKLWHALKNIVNFVLNFFKIGETIYVRAEYAG